MGSARYEWVWVVGAALGLAAGGCGLAQTAPGPDGGNVGGDASFFLPDSAPLGHDAGTSACGAVTCTGGTVCCNASCGICVLPGQGCPELDCSDAGPAPHFCGGLLDTPCDPSEFCDYPDGAACGATDASGVCRPRPTDCPEPGGVPVCGCDGTTYFGECVAQFSGVDVLHFGACEGPPPLETVSATASCAPFDGPAWTFTVAQNGPVCGGVPVAASLTIELWAYLEAATPGTTYTIETDFAHDGTASYCPTGGGGPPCSTLRGTVTVDAFTAGSSAILSYELTASDGTVYTRSNAAVSAWCSTTRLCG
ncbi:MAG: Kazal-type serine protease inhibitor domain-containing protein [Sandaracinus sp.]